MVGFLSDNFLEHPGIIAKKSTKGILGFLGVLNGHGHLCVLLLVEQFLGLLHRQIFHVIGVGRSILIEELTALIFLFSHNFWV